MRVRGADQDGIHGAAAGIPDGSRDLPGKPLVDAQRVDRQPQHLAATRIPKPDERCLQRIVRADGRLALAQQVATERQPSARREVDRCGRDAQRGVEVVHQPRIRSQY